MYLLFILRCVPQNHYSFNTNILTIIIHLLVKPKLYYLNFKAKMIIIENQINYETTCKIYTHDYLQ